MKKIKTINDWTAQEKLQALLDTASMTENELGFYIRTHGLYSSDLEWFKKELSSTTSNKGRPKLDINFKTFCRWKISVIDQRHGPLTETKNKFSAEEKKKL
jgi:hypothetical protein